MSKQAATKLKPDVDQARALAAFNRKLKKLQKLKEEADFEMTQARSPLAIERATGKSVTINSVLVIFKKDLKSMSVLETKKRK